MAVGAAPSIIDQIAIIKQRLDPQTQNLVQFAMATLIRDGSFDSHLVTLRAEHARRCAAMLTSIQRHLPPHALQFARPQGGLYLWCRVSPHISTRALLDRALGGGVAFIPGHAFYPDPAGDSELRLCFSSVAPAAVDEAIRRLRQGADGDGTERRRGTPQPGAGGVMPASSFQLPATSFVPEAGSPNR